MARMARVVAAGVPHHVTQRGNARQFMLASAAERAIYLELLEEQLRAQPVSVLGYCVMSNHVHLIAVPETAEALGSALRQAHGRYASYWNATHRSSGHVWQGRYYSCPLDESRVWTALRYVERNPVRAGLVARPEDWEWSSAAAHCGGAAAAVWLDRRRWEKLWSVAAWQQYLAEGEAREEMLAIRRATHTGKPWGETGFIEALERSLQRRLIPNKGGRPRKTDGRSLSTQLSLGEVEE
jgi:putative transposase